MPNQNTSFSFEDGDAIRHHRRGGISGKGDGFVMYSDSDIDRIAQEKERSYVHSLKSSLSKDELHAIKTIAGSHLTLNDVRLLVESILRDARK